MKLKTIWIFLVFLTTLTFILGKIEFSSYIFISLLLLTTFIKGQLVIDFFMDLKYVSSKYRLKELELHHQVLWKPKNRLFQFMELGYSLEF